MTSGVSLPRRTPKVWPLADMRTIRLLGLIACLSASALLVSQRIRQHSDSIFSAEPSIDDQLDSRLRQAAVSALQQREGTIIVIDPQSGRVRAVLNSEVAFEKAFAPGSTIKPFAALAALRAGLVSSDTRTLCREKYTHQHFRTVCSHPLHLAPLNPAEAIAYSCNYYFGKLGERLGEPEFRATLSGFGLGHKSGINVDNESGGRLSRAAWQPQGVLGDGDYLQVTPIQLLMAYSALVNGGRLLAPRVAVAKGFIPQVKAQIKITSGERDVLYEGMRGAIRFGTVERAGLNSLPLYILGKTGTSTPVNGFRTQGWFVGFATDTKSQSVDANLGVLVFLKRAHGSEAAEVSRKIFEEFAAARRDGETQRRGDEVIRVHLVRENITRTIALEDYVTDVVAAEGSMETKDEAMKALAVASRTYALKNVGRHAAVGYDFCNLTHCQRSSPNLNKASDLARRAVKETEGEVLRDNEGLAESYFSASCGGETANIATLWSTNPKSHLRGVKDEYCLTMPHSHWTDSISATNLLRAVNSDPRTGVGNELRDVFVWRRDQTGRAEQITIVGQHRRTVSGWDFKIIVGRALGWGLLKSSRFQVSRSGSNFVFRGSGFGHGLGLCQEGAHVMAERGFGYRRILAKYFPGTIVDRDVRASRKTRYTADLVWNVGQRYTSARTLAPTRSREKARLKISSEHFRVSYPLTVKQRDAEYLLQVLEVARGDLLNRPALLRAPNLPSLEIFINETTGDFVGRTGLPSWVAAGSRGDRIELQPIALLRRLGILETTLRHELVHKLVDVVGNGGAPRWLAEGLALYLAGEGPMISRHQPKTRISVADLERRLSGSGAAWQMRELYAAAYSEVRSLIKSEGEAAVWRRISGGGY